MRRHSLEDIARLDIRPIVREGDAFAFALCVNGQQIGSVFGHVDRDTLSVFFDLDGGGGWLDVALESTPCHYGGARWWARCPICKRRCAVLYLRASLARALAIALSQDSPGGSGALYLACRACVGLPYDSQSWGALQTLTERARRSERKAWPDPADRLWGCKPRGRWRRTHARLAGAHHAADVIALRRFLRLPE